MKDAVMNALTITNIVDVVIGAIIFGVCAWLLTDGFTDFVIWGRKNKHKFCEKCGHRVKLIEDSYDGAKVETYGHNHVYECPFCKNRQTVNCQTYDIK